MTTNFYDINKKIISRFSSNWNTLPIFTNNDDPDDLSLGSGFTHIDVHTLGSQQVSMSNPKRLRTKGYFVISISLPLDTGLKNLLQYADQICDIYRSKTVDGIVYLTPNIDNSRQIEYAKGKYYQISLNCPFWCDITYTS